MKRREEQYCEKVKGWLKPKDGFIHPLVIEYFCFSTLMGNEESYTNFLDTIIVHMQEKGYEIMDIKFINTSSYATIILYK